MVETLWLTQESPRWYEGMYSLAQSNLLVSYVSKTISYMWESEKNVLRMPI